MIYKYVNKKTISANREDAFKCIVECERWPDFIKECLSVQIIKSKGNRIVRVMESEVNKVKLSMKTEYSVDKSKYSIEFKQLKSPWPIKSNMGSWIVKKINEDKVEIVLIHKVEAKYGYLGDLLMKLFIGKKFVEGHAEKVLKEFKKELEKS